MEGMSNGGQSRLCQIECRYGRLHCTIMISGVDSVTRQEKSCKKDETHQDMTELLSVECVIVDVDKEENEGVQM